jgi:hypothetical protein
MTVLQAHSRVYRYDAFVMRHCQNLLLLLLLLLLLINVINITLFILESYKTLRYGTISILAIIIVLIRHKNKN